MQKPYSQSLLTYGRNKLFWQLGHTVTRVCQRSLHSHESFISDFSFFKKSCMKLICYWFETYYLLQLLQRVVSRRQYCSVHICVFQCHHEIRETFPEKPKKSWGNFKGLHWLFPTVFSLTVKVTILSAIFSGLTDLNSSLARQSLLMSTLPVNEFITVFTTSVILCIPSGW